VTDINKVYCSIDTFLVATVIKGDRRYYRYIVCGVVDTKYIGQIGI
jgi:hypothetical protein